MSARLSVSWTAYQKNICNGFGSLQQRGEFVDMTLAADGHHVQVHKMVMCLVSPYIKDLVTATQCAHPVIFLNNVSSATLELILQYVYTGEALVPREEIKEFLQACKSLHIKGLENTSTVELHRETEESYNMKCEPHNEELAVEEEIVEEHLLQDNQCGDDTYTNDEEPDQTMELPVVENTVTTSTPHPPRKLAKNKSLQELNKSRISEGETRVQYTITNQGNLQVILNRYVYCFRYHRTKTEEMVWRCVETKRNCPAIVVTKDGKVLERSKAHNHGFADRTILKRLQKGLVYSALSEAQRNANIEKEKKNDPAESNDESGMNE